LTVAEEDTGVEGQRDVAIVGEGGIIVNFGGEDFRWFDGIG
jgi:hypothetical protein